MASIAKKFFVASLIYFILGLVAQAVVGFDLWLGFNPLAYTTVTATEQILLIGWLSQLALALIYDRWLAPTRLESLSATTPNPKSGLVVFILFNLGLPLIIIGQPGLALFGGPWLAALTALGGLMQLFAGVILLREVWGLFAEKS